MSKMRQTKILPKMKTAGAWGFLMLAMAVIGRNDNMLRHPETGETHRA